ncbi:GAF domain-containing protein [Puteibacter caeruleilacunae]|nr:GAF domain-containing protein [Puteibacter caeruleilacunae]
MTHKDMVKCSFINTQLKSSLSFEYLIADIEKIAKQKDHPMVELARAVVRELKNAPELKSPIKNNKILDDNQPLINKMMAFVFNPLHHHSTLAVASAPFVQHFIYSSQLFERTFIGQHKEFELAEDFEDASIELAMIYQAYLIILDKYFDFKLNQSIPFNYKLTDTQTKAIHYYEKVMDTTYIDVKAKKKVKKLSHQEIMSLFDNTEDLDHWNERIPLDNFEFIGFLKFNFTDITHSFVLSQLKSDLLNKDAIITDDGYEQIRQRIAILLEIPDVDLGLTAFGDFESEFNENLIWKSLLSKEELDCKEFQGTIFEKAYINKKIILSEDLQQTERDKAINLLLFKGYRGHVVIPLMHDEEIVGMMEFGTKEPNKLNLFQLKRLYELFPMFAIALKRSKEDLDDRIRAIMQDEYTAIHPTVEWRFQQSALRILNEKLRNETPQLEPIIFNNVVPIYGASDIRSSTIARNEAIKSDLSEQLKMANDILTVALKDKEMPLLDHLSFKVDQSLNTVQNGLKAGDEVSILEFLRRDIEPVFAQLKKRSSAASDLIDKYFAELDPELKVIYKKRKDFECSLTRINDVVGEIIDQEQIKAQQVYPHYFEKYRTDGIEYNAYIGDSLVQNIPYSEIYLKNIRLWQLMVKVKVARKIQELNPELPCKLDITQLILVHSNPLSITFRQDEKKFDVAGAYNIRYEITKKRIDKATIKGTDERITQVGKIAIIYSHAEEIEEYKRYIDFLVAGNYLKEGIEYLDLEDLKGASGLRAIRVAINFNSSADQVDINMEKINNAQLS